MLFQKLFFKNHGHKMTIWSFELQAEDLLGEPVSCGNALHLVNIDQGIVHVHRGVVCLHGGHADLAWLTETGEELRATHLVVISVIIFFEYFLFSSTYLT